MNQTEALASLALCTLWQYRLWILQARNTKLERFLAKNQLYSTEITKGPGAKNDTSQNPGSFNQILSFES